MDRSAGTGLIGLGVVVAIAGAIMRYAITVNSTHNFNLHDIGLILLVAGIVLFALGLAVVLIGSRRRTMIRQDVRTTPQDQVRYEQRDDLL